MESTNQSITHNDVEGVDANPHLHNVSSGRSIEVTQVVIKRNPQKKSGLMKIGSWNVRTFNKEGRLENLLREMKRNEITIMGICEIHWEGSTDFVSDQYRIIGSGGDMKRNGVALVIDEKVCGEILHIDRISECIMMIKIKAQPVDMMIIQVYMPTSQAKEEDVDEVYECVQDILANNKGKYNTVIMGDFNAVVGMGKKSKCVGEFGLGKRNERGQKLVDFAKQNKFVITNTLFKHHKRRRYTWTRPGNGDRFQLDYVLVKWRYKNGVKNSRAYPGMDVYSDHNAVVMHLNVKFKKIKKAKKKLNWNLEELNKENGEKFIDQIENNIYTIPQETSEQLWNGIKEMITKSAEEHLGCKKKQNPKKPWITSEMIEKMDERRKWKNVNTEEGRKMYRKLNNLLRRETDKAKDKWLDEQCKEIEQLEKRGRSDLMYKRAKEVGKKYKRSKGMNAGLLDKNGNVLNDQEEIKERWKEYFEILYDAAGKPTSCILENEEEVHEDEKGPLIMLSETNASVNKLKRGKKQGMDNVPAELIKCLGDNTRKQLNKLDNLIYTSGKWPTDFTVSRVVTFPKKPNTKRCEEHRTISLISHASKIPLKTMYERIYAKVDDFIEKDQFGFRRKIGTREAITTLRVIYEKVIEFGQNLYICFVDYEKAFDRINWQKLMECLKQVGLDWRERRLIWELYTNQTAVITVGEDLTEPAQLGRGSRQGGILSTIIYNVYSQFMINEALENNEDGVVISGSKVPSIRFADDKAMISNSNAGLQRIMDSLNDAGKRYGMKINLKKTKVMRITHLKNRTMKIIVEGKVLEVVQEFKYLGSIITNDGRCETDIRRRIARAKASFTDNEILLTSNTNLELRKRYIKAVVWSNALYAAETWTLTTTDIKRLEAFEMWCWRRMLKINWMDKITNEEVLMLAQESRRIISVIRDRQKKWIGHIIRGDSLLKRAIERHFVGKPKKGRKRITFLSYLKDGQPYDVLKRRADNREEWRSWTPPT